ncbi:tetratricopeptide repeat protein [Nodosilinea sp. LEGE 07088]|uniref:tetratricopeptide repeat protein n=1 Tax=Nodosilinea sp. LEGE 07088 TaxID=2777968 RepID=UPI001D141ACD|nr:tetratricopeptide repeat protein [Nodosilinea sp. LEGE 07088]
MEFWYQQFWPLPPQFSARMRGLAKSVFVILLCLICLVGWGDLAWSQPEAAELSPETVQAIAELRQKAFTASQRGQFAEAETYWSELIDYLPNEAAVWSNRGNVRVSQNKLTEALDDYDQAVALAPEQPDPYLNRGAALEGLGRWDDAIADYSQVLALNPDDAAAYNNRGNAKAGQGNWEAALVDYQKAADLDPKFAFARVNTALAEYQLGHADEAIRQFRNLTRRYPNFADARAALTAALWSQGALGEAESNWVAVMGLDRRYKDLDWVSTVRRWPPAMVTALEKFLHLSSSPS